MSPPFQDFAEKNLHHLSMLKLEELGNASRVMWLHLAAILLPSHQAKIEHTKLILKFFEMAKGSNGISSLHYIHTLTSQVMFEMEEGTCVTSLWSCIE